uniref:CCHC-type domain-containing protein n=1 Tax=Trichogramma kaykai TaxID=54128 RepID=A0ABD2XHX3_9HYME
MRHLTKPFHIAKTNLPVIHLLMTPVPGALVAHLVAMGPPPIPLCAWCLTRICLLATCLRGVPAHNTSVHDAQTRSYRSIVKIEKIMPYFDGKNMPVTLFVHFCRTAKRFLRPTDYDFFITLLKTRARQEADGKVMDYGLRFSQKLRAASDNIWENLAPHLVPGALAPDLVPGAIFDNEPTKTFQSVRTINPSNQPPRLCFNCNKPGHLRCDYELVSHRAKPSHVDGQEGHLEEFPCLDGLESYLEIPSDGPDYHERDIDKVEVSSESSDTDDDIITGISLLPIGQVRKRKNGEWRNV